MASRDVAEVSIKHKPGCPASMAPTYELFAGVLASRCPECGRRVPHPRTLSRADLEERQ